MPRTHRMGTLRYFACARMSCTSANICDSSKCTLTITMPNFSRCNEVMASPPVRTEITSWPARTRRSRSSTVSGVTASRVFVLGARSAMGGASLSRTGKIRTREGRALAAHRRRAVQAAGDELLLLLAAEPAAVCAPVAVLHLVALRGLLLRAVGLDAIAHEAAPLGAFESAVVRTLGAGLVHPLMSSERGAVAVAALKAVRHEMRALGAFEALLLRLRVARPHALLVGREATVRG